MIDVGMAQGIVIGLCGSLSLVNITLGLLFQDTICLLVGLNCFLLILL